MNRFARQFQRDMYYKPGNMFSPWYVRTFATMRAIFYTFCAYVLAAIVASLYVLYVMFIPIVVAIVALIAYHFAVKFW
jgi:hypothetical protein